MSYHVFFCLASDETFSALWRRVWPRCLADLVGGKGAVAERSECCRERSRVGGGSVAEFCSGTSHQPPPTPQTHGNGARSKTAAPRTSSTQGAIIAAETAALRGCWRNDPRSGAGAKPKTERRTGSEIAEIRSDSVSSRQNRWAAMRRRASG